MGDTSPSPTPSDPHAGWIAVGQVMGAFGSYGDLRVKPLGRFPERFRNLRRVFVGEQHEPADVVHRKNVGPGVVLRLSTVQSRDAARELYQQDLYVPESEAVKLPKGEFFVHQIVGLTVVTTGGETIGRVRDIIETGSNDVYVVERASPHHAVAAEPGVRRRPVLTHQQREVLLPATKEVIKGVDLDAGTIEVDLLPGLLD